MIFENKITSNKEQFLAKVKAISKDLGIKPDWLMAAMYLESGFRHNVVNEIGAVGLIQFIPSTYQKWGYSQYDLTSMTNVQQLDVVYKYLLPFKNRIKSYADLHTIIFFPAKFGMNKNDIFETSSISAKAVATSNKSIDLNKDSQITKKEFETYLYNKLQKSGLTKSELRTVFGTTNENLKYYILGSVVIVGISLYIWTLIDK